MKSTNVDEMLLQMIEPKVHQIQEKFSNGEGLSSEDINTILLKSQYNHINHLDEKLNEVTTDVSSLKSDFSLLRAEFRALESKLDARLTAFEANIDFKIQKAINSNMRWSIGLIALLVTIFKLIDVLASKLPNLF
jgi:uncharacterized coiled-coil DUF342 family protein